MIEQLRGRCKVDFDGGVKPDPKSSSASHPSVNHSTERLNVTGCGNGSQDSIRNRVHVHQQDKGMSQNKGTLSGSDPVLLDITSIFPTIPIVQPARDHDFS